MADIKIIACGKKHLKDASKLSEKVFGSPFFRENYMKEPYFKPSNIFMLYENGLPASMACILPRIMRLDGQKTRLAGVGGVATAPEFRGRGYAALVMKEAIEAMEKRGFSLSVLYPYKIKYYEQFGYGIFVPPFFVLDLASIKAPAKPLNVRKLNRPDYASLKRVYDSFSLGLTGAVERPLSYWKNYCEYWDGQSKQMCWKDGPYFCAFEKGRIIAYMRLESIRRSPEDKKYRLKISELGCLKGKEYAFDALLYEAKKHASALGFNKLYYDDIPGGLANGRKPSKAEKLEYRNYKSLRMYRICSFPALMRVLGRAFDSRLKKEGLRKNWRNLIRIDRQANGSRSRILISTEARSRPLVLTDSGFIKLALGLKTVKNNRILRILFPLLKPVYWDFDYL